MKHKKLHLNSKQRYFFYKSEMLQKVFKLLFLFTWDNYFKLIIKKKFFCKIAKNCFRYKIKNYCVITGRSRSINQKYKISRISFRLLISEGILFGFKKGT
jgi:ribosomal protein S14